MNKRLLLTLLSLWIVFNTNAQENKGQAFSLSQAIDYAVANSNNVKNSQLDVRSSKAKVGEIRSIGLPQIKAEGQILHYLIIPKSFLPAQFLNPEAPEGTFVPVQFQPEYFGTAGITVSQLLFDGSYIVGLQAASTYTELSKKGLQQSKVETAEAVSKAYYSALVNQERLDLLKSNVARLDSLHKETEVMYKNGFVEKIDLNRIEVQLNNLKAETQKVERMVIVSYHLLKFQMGMDIYETIILTDQLSIEDLNYDLLDTERAEYSKRPEYSILQTQRKLTELDIRNNRVGYLPRLVALGNYGYNRGSNQFDFFREKWFNNAYIGMALQVPIFDGLEKTYKIQQAKISRQKADNNLKQMEQTINFQVESAKAGLKNNAEALTVQSRNLELAKEVSEVTKIKYEQGVGSNIELINAETSLKEAQTNYYEALYAALVARVELQKALGILYE